MVLAALEGFTVGITADRRHEEQAALLERRGARVLHGPAIRTLPLTEEPHLERVTRELVANPPDVVVLTTGLGARGWFAAAESTGLDAPLARVLSGATILARGPKAAGAAAAFGLDVAWRAPSERASEVVDRLAGTTRRVAVQRDGGAAPALALALAAGGADVVDVAVYRWLLPDDPAPACRLIDAACAGSLDAVTFTSSPAVWNLLDLAGDRRAALLRAFATTTRAVCVGPVCLEAAEAAGVARAVAPERGRLGRMVRLVEQALGGAARRLSVAGVDVVVQGATAIVAGEPVALTERERQVLDRLLAAGGAVVAKGALVPGADPHAAEVAVARLRSRLGPAGRGIVAVPRRGYRLAPR